MIVVQVAGIVLFAASTAYLVLALFRVAGFRERTLVPAERPAVTLMLPCHGAPSRLYECLRSVCDQDYPGLQVVFGVHTGDDPALAVIERLRADLPHLDCSVVIDPRRLGSNPKNCNLANMMVAVRHDVLVIVDSDVLVEKGFLDTIVAPLAEAGVGGVTCLYKGSPEADLASRLGALYINDFFIPSVLVDIARHEMSITYGAAAAVKREALDKIGGFAAMASAVAQDYVLGYELCQSGAGIRLAPQVVCTTVAEKGLVGLYRHEMRWMRAIRAVRPREHLLWIVTTAFVPLLLLAWAWPFAVAASALAVHLVLRVVLHYLVRNRIALPRPQPLLVPVREVLNFVLWIGSLLGRRVRWGDNVMVTGGGLTMRKHHGQNDQPGSSSDPVGLEEARVCNLGGKA
jgi:ceramide glucosyltransferase